MKNTAKNEKISVIIPTRNRIQPVIECLKSISIQTKLPDEIVIVDSSDKKELLDKLKKIKKLRIKYVHTERAGSAYQRNFGAKKSSGDIIVFSDDDTIWDRNYLKEIMYVFERYPKDEVGAVMGKPILKKGTPTKEFLKQVSHVLDSIFLLTSIGNGKFHLSGLPSVLPNGIEKITKCEFIYGFAVAFRKDVFEEFWWDESFKGYVWNEDDDLAYRVSRKYSNFFAPSARILHNILHVKRIYSADKSEYIAKKKKIIYHYYFFKKNMPQDLKHTIAFWWSVIGIIITESIKSVISRDFNGVIGLFSGLNSILNKKSINKNEF